MSTENAKVAREFWKDEYGEMCDSAARSIATTEETDWDTLAPHHREEFRERADDALLSAGLPELLDERARLQDLVDAAIPLADKLRALLDSGAVTYAIVRPSLIDSARVALRKYGEACL